MRTLSFCVSPSVVIQKAIQNMSGMCLNASEVVFASIRNFNM